MIGASDERSRFKLLFRCSYLDRETYWKPGFIMHCVSSYASSCRDLISSLAARDITHPVLSMYSTGCGCAVQAEGNSLFCIPQPVLHVCLNLYCTHLYRVLLINRDLSQIRTGRQRTAFETHSHRNATIYTSYLLLSGQFELTLF